jgi:hypothetical protein
MIFQRAGFDQFLAELAALSEAQMTDQKFMDALNSKYDICGSTLPANAACFKCHEKQ